MKSSNLPHALNNMKNGAQFPIQYTILKIQIGYLNVENDMMFSCKNDVRFQKRLRQGAPNNIQEI